MSLIPEHGWTPDRYAIFRAVFGTYLAVHFFMLIPWGPEVFSNAGVLPDPAASPLAFFPNIFAWVGEPWFVLAGLVAATVASVAFGAGVADRWLAIGLWYVWAALMARNPLIANPGIPFVGWLLLMHACLPTDDEGRTVMPRSIWFVAWIVMAAGYTYGGLSKLPSVSWLDGTALLHVWESPLARDTALRAWLVDLPTPVIRLATWGTLLLEILALPLALVPATRRWVWLALTLMHAGILATVAFADLTLGMLCIHLITFDPKWFEMRRDLA